MKWLLIICLFILKPARGQEIKTQSPNFRFGYLKNNYYESYHDMDIFNRTCTIAQFTSISDTKLLYRFTWEENNSTIKINKGQMILDPSYLYRTCFILSPHLENVQDLCIEEIGNPTADFIIFTNKNNDFHYGMIKNLSWRSKLLERLLYYNTSQLFLYKEVCNFQLSVPDKSNLV